ncbi:MAG: GNAT family N-acetyltransferase [Sphingomonas adhaesiva]|uniref:GNAT family N-acetyltransferase n=1 Tax=Sphingomonas adhaesiva TaxID=28212 RepID=UPI002FFC01E1
MVTAAIIDEGGWDTIAGAWDSLADEAVVANPFYRRDVVAACRGLREAGTPRLLAVRDGDALLGVLPIATRRKGGIALSVENWDQRVRALGEPLVRGGREQAFWGAALPVLARGPGHFLRLSALDADSASTRALMAMTRCTVTRRYERAVLERGLSSAEHAARHVRGKVLKEHRRLRARLAERGALRFERLAPEEAAGAWIDTLFALETSGWKGREGVAAAADPATERCFRAILTDAHARGALDFHRMTVGDATIAMLANVESGDESFQLKIAYDEEWAAFSPGVLIEMAYLEHALDVRGLARADSCARAGHPMIDRLWPARRTIVSLAVPFDNVRSRLMCRGIEAWRRRRANRREQA